MNLKEAVKTCVCDKYLDFSTRATRKEFWYFIFAVYLFTLAFYTITFIVDTLFGGSFQLFRLTVGIAVVISLLLMVPTWAVGVRRLHDTGHSGWWMFLYFLPYIGFIALLIMFCKKSDDDNKYGPKPIE